MLLLTIPSAVRRVDLLFSWLVAQVAPAAAVVVFGILLRWRWRRRWW